MPIQPKTKSSRHRWRDLVINVAHALSPAPWLLPRAFFGDPSSWTTTHIAENELSLLQPGQWRQGLTSAWNATVPAWPGKPRGVLKLLPKALFRESSNWPYPCQSTPQNPWPEQSWMFINGICTDDNVLQLNARCLHRLFGRPLTLLHNQTAGVGLDLAECALGKGWLQVTEAVRKLFPAFLSELQRPEINKVVLIAHSQGTILTAVFLHLLRLLLDESQQLKASAANAPECRHAKEMLFKAEEKSESAASESDIRGKARRVIKASGANQCDIVELKAGETSPYPVKAWLDWAPDAVLALPELSLATLKKLEIYSFATCATELFPRSGVPYIEHFGNQQDMVAKLGMFAAETGPGRTRIGGHQFEHPDAWGHLFNAHYLANLEAQFRNPEAEFFKPREGTTIAHSRLFDYWREQQAVGFGRPV